MTQPTVGEYFVQRVQELGVDTIFGVPAVTCEAVFDAAQARGLSIVVTGSDLEAGYAADGYARVRGLGVASVSYGVGTLSLINAVAGAFVETSPVVIINGGPSALNLWNQRRYGVLFSHSTGRDNTDFLAFKAVTSLAVSVETASEAPEIIDGALAHAFLTQKPVYVEIPKDILVMPCPAPTAPLGLARAPTGAEPALAKMVQEQLAKAKAPAILLGEDVQRLRLQSQCRELIGRLKLPWATTILGKAVLDERLPGFVGVYENSPKPARDILAKADFILALGCAFSTGYRTLVRQAFDKMAHYHDGWLRLANEPPVRAELGAFLSELTDLFPSDKSHSGGPLPPKSSPRRSDGDPGTTPLTHDNLFKVIDKFIDETWLVVADTGLATSVAADLNTVGEGAFMSNAVWASIGHSVGAGFGASLGGDRRPLIVCGDGGFQMTAQTLSTMARYGSSCVVVLIDNGLYAIEQYLIDPRFFSDPSQEALPYVRLPRWRYEEVARGMGVTSAVTAGTIGAFEAALHAVKSHSGPALIVATVDERDLPAELR